MNLSEVIIPQIYKIKIPKAGDWFVCTKHLKQYIASPFISNSTHLSQIIRKFIVVNINSPYENFGNAVSIPHREAQNGHYKIHSYGKFEFKTFSRYCTGMIFILENSFQKNHFCFSKLSISSPTLVLSDLKELLS
jgi:hypothetical protein